MLTKILADLVSFRTITPNGDNAINYCSEFLSNLGFKCTVMKFGIVTNLYAKYGNFPHNICFAGHIDVVPPLDGWKTDPFVLTAMDGKLYGRGSCDMKGGIAAVFTAIAEYLSQNRPNFSISIMLTSDEEIMSPDGTKSVIEYLKSKNEKITGCVLCESCSPENAGEYIKIGCRGSINIKLTSRGTQCHVINGTKYGNHLHSFVNLLSTIVNQRLDDGNEFFDKSDIELTSIDVGNKTCNIIPSLATAKLNVRFNDYWPSKKLIDYINNTLSSNVIAEYECCGEAFIGSDMNFINFCLNAVRQCTNGVASFGTKGGNSDAQFIKNITQVVEIGSSIKEAHIANEFISINDLKLMKKIYKEILIEAKYFFTKTT